jgi:hypothetical protein
MAISQTHIGCLVAKCIGGKVGSGYQFEVDRFIKTNGLEWTARRYKAIWNAALHLRNGDKEAAIAIYRRYSVSYHSGSCTPKGNVGAAVRNFLASDKPSSIRRWSALLRYYTGLRLKVASKSQIDVMVRNITEHPPENPYFAGCEKAVLSEWSRFVSDHRSQIENLRDQMRPSHGEDLKGSVEYYSPVPTPRCVREDYYGPWIHSLLTSGYLPRSLLPTLAENLKIPAMYAHGKWCQEGTSRIAGQISLIQEGGTKLRAVATPNGWIQLAFRPLHTFLKDIGQLCPESCVEDQLSGVNQILEVYNKGGKVNSIDLSAATDRLPRSTQVEMLRMVGLPQFATALDEVSSAKWIVRDKDRTQQVTYSVGQPMGIYGSFPLLNLMNIMIARLSCRLANREFGTPMENQFRVLGDDIVIFDDRIAGMYSKVLAGLGVEISKEKSFQGNVAQFAGFNILPTRGGCHYAYRPYKHSDSIRVNNPIDFVNALGKSVRNLKDPVWTSRFERFQQTASKRLLDLSPDIWVKEEVADSPRSLSRATVASITNKLMLAYREIPGTHVSLAKAISGSLDSFSLFSFEEKGDFAVPQGIERSPHRNREREEFSVERRFSNDPLLKQAEKPRPYVKAKSIDDYMSRIEAKRVSRDSVMPKVARHTNNPLSKPVQRPKRTDGPER